MRLHRCINQVRAAAAAVFLLIPSTLYAQHKETVTVSTVKIIISGKEYIWKEKDKKPQLPEQKEADGIDAGEKADHAVDPDDGTEMKPETVCSFLGFYPGQVISPQELEKEAERSSYRLNSSGYFYEAAVQIIPPRKKPKERTVIVTAEKGFLQRYGGGAMYGMYGIEGLAGERSGIRFYAGWDTNGVSYIHHHAAGLPLIFGAEIFSKNLGPALTADNSEQTVSSFQGKIRLGYYISPDISINTDIRAYIPVIPSFSSDSAFYSIEPNISIERSVHVPLFTTWDAQLRSCIFPQTAQMSAEISAAVRTRLLPFLQSAFHTSAGAAPSDILVYGMFNLFSDQDRRENRIIRSGYSEDELSCSSYLYASAELRARFFNQVIPPAFKCTAHAFLFADAAYLAKDNEMNFVDAFGAGLRILFDNPVFASFTFAYGVNHSGSARFSFSASAGY